MPEKWQEILGFIIGSAAIAMVIYAIAGALYLAILLVSFP